MMEVLLAMLFDINVDDMKTAIIHFSKHMILFSSNDTTITIIYRKQVDKKHLYIIALVYTVSETPV